VKSALAIDGYRKRSVVVSWASLFTGKPVRLSGIRNGLPYPPSRQLRSNVFIDVCDRGVDDGARLRTA
jgi:hypothetical protein